MVYIYSTNSLFRAVPQVIWTTVGASKALFSLLLGGSGSEDSLEEAPAQLSVRTETREMKARHRFHYMILYYIILYYSI